MDFNCCRGFLVRFAGTAKKSAASGLDNLYKRWVLGLAQIQKEKHTQKFLTGTRAFSVFMALPVALPTVFQN
jgi:hypothetical protein